MSSRKERLKSEFDAFFKEVLGQDIFLYDSLSLENFIKLKKIVSCVNNIITMQVTENFIYFLENEKVIDSNQKEVILNQINTVNANSNGYDVEYSQPILNGSGILAEVKCNIPVKENNFGAAQQSGIRKDIEGLKKGKRKARKNGEFERYYKFMVFLDDGKTVVNAVKNICSKINDTKVEILTDNINAEQLQTDVVYVVTLPMVKKSR